MPELNSHATAEFQDPLADKLQAFEIDQPGIDFPFSVRLARENAWSHEFALRVIAEYKRFVYLALRAGHPVTPSDEVDQAWHLHLTYTESYWNVLCGEVLGKPFHHNPTEGGPDEQAKYFDWYSRTLESYERIFGEAPPGDVWPEPVRRFAGAGDFVRVNRNQLAESGFPLAAFSRSVRPRFLAASVAVGLTLSFGAVAWTSGPEVSSSGSTQLSLAAQLGVWGIGMLIAIVGGGYYFIQRSIRTCPGCGGKDTWNVEEKPIPGGKEYFETKTCTQCGHTTTKRRVQNNNQAGCGGTGMGCSGSGCGGIGGGGSGCGGGGSGGGGSGCGGGGCGGGGCGS